MDRLQERLEQASKALQALRELTDVSAPSLVQRDAILLRFMLASEAIWKAAQRYLQERRGWLAQGVGPYIVRSGIAR